MPQAWSAQLEKHFWPKGSRRDVWLVLDGARDPRVFRFLLESSFEYACLYSGFIPKSLEAAAPYLIHLEFDERYTRRLIDHAWGNAWGVFLKCDTRLEWLRRHLRGFLSVRDPGGQRLLFRYYDPRVLRTYLPSCSKEELRTFFGPIEGFWVEDENPNRVLQFGCDGSRVVLNQVSLDAPSTPVPFALNQAKKSAVVRYRPGMVAIRRDQWSLFSQDELRKFENWMIRHLQKFFPRQAKALDESKLRETIQHGVTRARGYGITAKRDVCKYIDVMMALGQDFDKDKRLSWATRILEQRNSSGGKAQALLQAAIRHLKQPVMAHHA